MKQEDKLKDKYGVSGGWKVPDGYFDHVFKEIESKLPEYPQTPVQQDMTVWQRMKPYVYLAAMFAGIWLMMNVFHRVSGNPTLSLDNPPEQIAQAMVEPEISDMFILPETMTDFVVEDEISDHYSSIEEFKEDFGYELEPEYSEN